ncbi:MAG: type VI secretion system-associated protein TagO [Xanthomonadales bacterium]|nr:type VI secretion system-associated protein TagO [Xanthomonadales bacterium]
MFNLIKVLIVTMVLITGLMISANADASTPTKIGNWGSLTEGKNTVIWIKSTPDTIKHDQDATLIIRCVKGKLSLAVDYHRPLSGRNFMLATSADGKDFRHASDWNRSGSKIFASSPVGNVLRMLDATYYHVRLYNSGIPLRAAFEVAGIKEAIKPIQKFCKKL